MFITYTKICRMYCFTIHVSIFSMRMYGVGAFHLRFSICKDAWSSFCKECCARTSFDAFVCNRLWLHFCSPFHLHTVNRKKSSVYTTSTIGWCRFKDVLFQQLSPAILQYIISKHSQLLCVTLICFKRAFINDKIVYLCIMIFHSKVALYISQHYIAILTTKDNRFIYAVQ